MLKILLVTFTMIGCKAARTEGDAKFITVAHDDHDRFVNGENILIKRVHEEHWDIFYRFHKDCPASRKTEKNYQTLRQKLEEGIRIWLAPLQDITNKPIVDKFIFYKSKETNRYIPENDSHAEYEINATFWCKKGTSGAIRSSREINILERWNGRKSPIFGNLPYSETALLHELGHAFDLADTYVGNSSFSPPNTSTYLTTIGNQPKSIMSSSGCPNLKLCLDDKRAIQWLYRYHYEGLDPKECPPEFVYEELTHTNDRYTNRTVGGCVYRQPLIIELRQKHLGRAKSLIDNTKNLKINDKDKRGHTALHYVARLYPEFSWGDIRYVLREILKHPDVDINITNKWGNTPLHTATWAGNDAMVHDLLFVVDMEVTEKENIMLNAQNDYGVTALHYAGKLGRNNCAKFLLERTDIDPNIKDSRFGNTPLHEAAKNGHTEVVKMLLAHKDINRNIRNRAGKTARQLAEQNSHEETAEAFD